MDSRVSAHGELRIRKRHGLPSKAVERQARNAYARGKKPHEFSGGVRKYLNGLQRRGEFLQSGTDVRVYGYSVFLFAADGTLVTTWPLHRKLRAMLEKDRPEANILEFTI